MEMGYARGPGLKEILDALLEAKLDGEAEGRRGEEKWVRENFPQASA